VHNTATAANTSGIISEHFYRVRSVAAGACLIEKLGFIASWTIVLD